MGQRDIRQLIVAGDMSVIVSKQRFDVSNMSSWLMRLLDEKPKKVVAVGLANRMVRVLWHITVHGTEYDSNESCTG